MTTDVLATEDVATEDVAATDVATTDLAAGLRARIADGPGEVLLWVHGYTLDSRSWATLWSRMPGLRHVGVDLPGHGISDPMAPAETLASLGARVADAARAIGARHVVGLSFGSMVALQVVLSRPEDFVTLCLGAPAMAGGPAVPEVGRRHAELADLHRQLGPGPWLRELWMTSPPDLFRHSLRHADLRQSLTALIDDHRWEEFVRPGVTRLAIECQPVETLSGVRAATLVLVGDQEFDAFKRTAAILEQGIPDCRVMELPDTGHLCMLERPETSARLIADHVNAHAMPTGARRVPR